MDSRCYEKCRDLIAACVICCLCVDNVDLIISWRCDKSVAPRRVSIALTHAELNISEPIIDTEWVGDTGLTVIGSYIDLIGLFGVGQCLTVNVILDCCDVVNYGALVIWRIKDYVVPNPRYAYESPNVHHRDGAKDRVRVADTIPKYKLLITATEGWYCHLLARSNIWDERCDVEICRLTRDRYVSDDG